MENTEHPYFDFQKTRDFGSLIGDTFDFIIKNFKILSKSVLIIMVPVFLVLIAWIGISGLSILKFYSGNMGSIPPYLFLVLGIEAVLGMFFYVLLVCINYDFIKLYIERKGAPVTLGDLWAEIKNDFRRVLLNLIGLSLLLGIFTAIVVGIIAAIGILVSEALAAVLAVLAFLVLFTYLAAALYPALFVIVYEKKRAFGAIFRSVKLVSGRWWYTFGLINVILIVWMILAMIASLPYYAVIFIISFHGIENVNTTLFVPVFVLSYIFLSFFGALMYMIPLTNSALLFFNLRERKEASSLFAKVENLEAHEK